MSSLAARRIRVYDQAGHHCTYAMLELPPGRWAPLGLFRPEENLDPGLYILEDVATGDREWFTIEPGEGGYHVERWTGGTRSGVRTS